MVWLDICDDLGNAIYFDVHHVERKRVERRWRHAVTGICGNGLHEVEVLVEPAGRGEVTFFDLSPGAKSLDGLLGSVNTSCLESSLVIAAMRHCEGNGRVATANPHPGAVPQFHAFESAPIWRSCC